MSKRAGKKASLKTKSRVGKNIKRIFLITKIILCIIPFATLGYLSIGELQYGLNYQELLRSNPVFTITFLSAMCQPFAAWLLNIAEKRVESYDYADALITILLIFVAECMLKNWLGIAATAILFWLVNREMPYTLKQEFKSVVDWKPIILDASGCLVLNMIAGLCLFASFRLG